VQPQFGVAHEIAVDEYPEHQPVGRCGHGGPHVLLCLLVGVGSPALVAARLRQAGPVVDGGGVLDPERSECDLHGRTLDPMGLDVDVSVHELIQQLPEISIVRDRSRAMAVLDAIMSPDWDSRYYSFDARWSPTEEMASMRDGSGNDYSIVFSPAGAYARGFDHESPMSPYRVTPPVAWPGLFDGVPEAFRHYVTEPAFGNPDGTPRVTVCFWRTAADAGWRAGGAAPLPAGVEDGESAEWLFDVLTDGRPQAYQQFAEEYYEAAVDIEAVRHVYALRPLTPSVVAVLNPDVDLAALGEDLAQTGYPPS
jgi:hypothetical protein